MFYIGDQENWIAMQRWEMSSWVFCITLKIVAFGNTKESTSELRLATDHYEHWTATQGNRL